MDVRKADSIRCSSGIGNDCGHCESCILRRKLAFSHQWMVRISESRKQKYIRMLLQQYSTMELTSSLLGLLQPLQYKDFTYAKSKVNSTFDNELSSIANPFDKSIQSDAVTDYMLEDEQWFLAASHWAKFNYMISVFRFCNSYTLENLKSFLAKLYEKGRKKILSTSHGSIGDTLGETLRYTSITEKDFPTFKNELVAKKSKSTISFSSSSQRPSCSIARFSSNFKQDDNIDADDDENNFFELNDSCSLQSTPVSTKASLFYQQSHHSSHLSARCHPYTGWQNFSRHESNAGDSEQYLSCEIDDLGDSVGMFETRITYNALPKQRDFIRRLPVHISKYILGFLDQPSLMNCICVSKHWRVLAEEVKNEMLAQQITREDIMLIQGSTENIPNPVYARIISLHVPKITESGDFILNDQARHIDVMSNGENFEDENMQDCYDGIETITVDVEARHVYCGAYNVLVLNSMKDSHRVTFYDGGKYVPVASVDRRIRLLDVKSGRCEKTIVEHVGSVKSVCTDETRGFVLSGSYDTTIRFWDIKSGRCQRIFLGHKSSVVTLSLSKKYLATGSTDKTCKVWNLNTGKCIRTFRHKNVIHCASIGEQLLLTGCAGGKVRVWDFKMAKLMKSLEGHMGPITCTKFDENHIVTGSKDCYAMLWSTKGNYGRCLQTFRHPKEVNCLEMMYCRIITGSVDGKIRVWNLLNGECLRIIRGNSRNDPITALYASENRLIINTKSNLLLYNFEAVTWDYHAPAERMSDYFRKGNSLAEDRPRQSWAFNRAQAMRRGESDLARKSILVTKPNGDNLTNQSGFPSRSNRVNSAPTWRSNDNSVQNSVQKHITRIHSAVSTRKALVDGDIKDPGSRKGPKSLSKKTESDSVRKPVDGNKDFEVKKAWGNVLDKGLSHTRSPVKCREEGSGLDLSQQRIITRSRSAPAHRIRSLPKNERGFTSSSHVNIRVWENKLNLTKPAYKSNIRPFSASTTSMKNPAETLDNLKLKTFYQQLQYETQLSGKKSHGKKDK
ncbi:F-box and WD repeat domain containing protein 10B-like [Rhopilema esculentum]|uniref:F-box and WD repeat domain containing protein 10B-like n=1 Tax=Rhopilema esculentum TaxID=499914 RepID=UPI0031DA0E56